MNRNLDAVCLSPIMSLLIDVLFCYSAGTYSLQIRPVTLDDDGRFQCQVSPGPEPGSTAIRSRYATLAVHIQPEPPQIVQGTHLMTTEDREVELECQSRGGKPPAEVNSSSDRSPLRSPTSFTLRSYLDAPVALCVTCTSLPRANQICSIGVSLPALTCTVFLLFGSLCRLIGWTVTAT